MSKLNTKEVHERRHRRIFDRHELESIITNWVHHEVRDAHGSDDDVVAVDYKLTFEDETEGSPRYKVGTRCIVDVVEVLASNRTQTQAEEISPPPAPPDRDASGNPIGWAQRGQERRGA